MIDSPIQGEMLLVAARAEGMRTVGGHGGSRQADQQGQGEDNAHRRVASSS
ncbi:MAG: hypothetical protein IRY99_11960 [Isosphaeraceae bacterium]|nr:hypothetical protein [Isosphaeraceae bacterium]